MGIESLLRRIERQSVTPVTACEIQPLRLQPAPQATCTLVTPVTPEMDECAQQTDSDWLNRVADSLNTTPARLIADTVFLPDEIAGYLDHDPGAVANALRRTWPQRFPERVRADPDDDRRHCHTCANLTGTRCRARRLKVVMDDLPRRCPDYRPKPGDPDPRPGAERWPWMMTPPETTP